MDFTKPIFLSNQSGGLLDINSIAASDLTASVGPRSGYKVMAASVGASNAVGYVDKRAVDDGVDVGDAYLTGRQIDIQCAVFGSTLADFHSKMQELSDIMRINPRFYDNSFGFRELKFSQATIDTSTYTDGVAPLRFVVRPMGVPNVVYNQAASIDHSVTSSASRGFSSTINLTFMAREPYRHRQTERQISINVSSVSSSSTTTSLPNVGTAFARPVVEIIHPSSTTAGVTVASVFQCAIEQAGALRQQSNGARRIDGRNLADDLRGEVVLDVLREGRRPQGEISAITGIVRYELDVDRI
jgi:hypothetical protein